MRLLRHQVRSAVRDRRADIGTHDHSHRRRSVIIPELTKPTTMTVVAEDDCMIAVITAPTKTPRYRFVVRRSKICFILFPAAASIPWLIIFIPYRKSAKPPNNDANSFAPHFIPLFFVITAFFCCPCGRFTAALPHTHSTYQTYLLPSTGISDS